MSAYELYCDHAIENYSRAHDMLVCVAIELKSAIDCDWSSCPVEMGNLADLLHNVQELLEEL